MLLTPIATGNDALFPSGTPGRYWQEKAAERAGFNLAAWRPETGFAQTKPYVWGAYDYYRGLQLEHEPLRWSGMAYGIGPTFAAALQDLSVFNTWISDAERRLSRLPKPIADSVMGVMKLVGGRTGIDIARDLETRLLRMQRKIFLDQGMQHEAYIGGGLPAIKTLVNSGAIDAKAGAAWASIDRGVRTKNNNEINAGNLELLRREQMQIIAQDYDELRRLTHLSPFVTYLLTVLGRPAIPGAKEPRKVVPIRVGPVKLPIPGIDISRANDRWKVIEKDTWPAYTKLIHEQPFAWQRMLETSLDQRIKEGKFRMLPDRASATDIAKFMASYALTKRGIAS